jgi:hypothetical protein
LPDLGEIYRLRAGLSKCRICGGYCAGAGDLLFAIWRMLVIIFSFYWFRLSMCLRVRKWAERLRIRCICKIESGNNTFFER